MDGWKTIKKPRLPEEGMFRICGQGDLGRYEGKPIYDEEAALDRLDHFKESLDKVWIEKFASGSWRKYND